MKYPHSTRRMGKPRKFTNDLKDSKAGVEFVTDWLLEFPGVVRVKNVEDNKEYQKDDIDLLVYPEGRDLRPWTVEVKTDTYRYSGNFFFETFSNMERMTPGCFLSSKADFLFYYFINEKRLYTLPLSDVREWFLANINEFEVAHPRTMLPGGRGHYVSQGYKVPTARVLRDIKDAREYRNAEGYEQIKMNLS